MRTDVVVLGTTLTSWGGFSGAKIEATTVNEQFLALTHFLLIGNVNITYRNIGHGICFNL